MQMIKTVEYQCIHCKGKEGKFKTFEEAEKHAQEKHNANPSM